MNEIPADPRGEFQRRLDERRSEGERWGRIGNRVSAARGATFLAALALLAAWKLQGLSPAWLIAPGCVFTGLVIWHDRVDARRSRLRRAVSFYERGLARLDDRWAGAGPDGRRYVSEEHPFSADLDVFGEGSLFQLLCAARTRPGEDALARWLSEFAPRPVVAARQEAVGELRPRLDLREALALLGDEVHDELDQTRLVGWSQEPPQLVPMGWRIAATALGACGVAAVVSWAAGWTRHSPLVAVLTLEFLFMGTFGRRIKRIAAAADDANSGLAILSQVLRLIERERFDSASLRKVRADLDSAGRPPSALIHALHQRIQNLNNCLANQFFAPIAFLLCLPVHFVQAIEVWRRDVGPHIPDWLHAVGEFEAVSSLAGHAWERPGDATPTVLDGPPRFVAAGLGHPLIPERECVRNDVSLGGELRLLMVSGSNMSGKSTLLRTIGVNLALAHAGAPVRAARLEFAPMQIATAMRVHDSLQAHTSLFYAVVRRLKLVVDLSRDDRPLLFLLDEILQGTNSHDRRLGAQAVIRALVEAGAIGLVTTHDLALTRVVDELGPRAANIHFEDRLESGRMTFDYRIRAGVVQRSNALELMRLMGIPVPGDEGEPTRPTDPESAGSSSRTAAAK